MSIDDMKIRAKVGKSTIEMLEKAGCLEGMFYFKFYSI